MDGPKTFYVTTSNQGYPLTLNGEGSASGVTIANTTDYNKAHEWIVEHADKQQLAALRKLVAVETEDEPNVVALKSVANGKYLYGGSYQEHGAVGTGPRQWWRIARDRVAAPGACRLDLYAYHGAPREYSLSWGGSDIQKGQPGSGAVLSFYKVSIYDIYDYGLPLM
jgi:hypothetical protein